MPQMMPINWLMLFIFFSVIFLLFNMMNYYSILPPTMKSKSTKTLTKNYLNWKW